MLQAVLVALLACLLWGGPSWTSTASRSGGGGGGDGGGGAGDGDGSDLMLSNREDVSQHLEGSLDAQRMANFTEEELRYHYFQSHDYDGNKVLDGMEMLKAVLHASPKKTSNLEAGKESLDSASGSETDDEDASVPSNMQFYVGVIDRVLSEGDLNRDGFLSYPEYVLVNRRALERKIQEDLQSRL